MSEEDAESSAPGAPGSAPGALGPDVVDDQGAAADLKPAAVEPIDWDARIRDAVAETLRKRDARRTERQELAERRTAGLAARHARKLGRQTRTQPQRGRRGVVVDQGDRDQEPPTPELPT